MYAFTLPSKSWIAPLLSSTHAVPYLPSHHTRHCRALSALPTPPLQTFPTMTAAVLLQPDGETVVGLPADAVLPADLLAAITTFKKTANAFGAALSQQDCPVIHIRGKATLFSCYDIDRYVRLPSCSSSLPLLSVPLSSPRPNSDNAPCWTRLT